MRAADTPRLALACHDGAQAQLPGSVLAFTESVLRLSVLNIEPALNPHAVIHARFVARGRTIFEIPAFVDDAERRVLAIA